MDAFDDEPPARDLDVLQAAFPVEWREPPLGEEDVAVWEDEHGVRLPEPYRSFITHITNGSSYGPPEDGGLLPLGWLPPGWPDQGDRDPATAFPLEQAWPWEDEEVTATDFDQRTVDVYNHGSIVLGTDDELSYWLLVTTGPQRGKIWLVSEVGAYPYPGPEAIGFVEWVQRWQAGSGWWD
nr:SMI1/KNR4 family protein [Kitasatospora viridis]